ncbi:MAG: hypothetical protein OEV94_10990 [Deltaproteobacteria bacterium]|nr:hypothetical protein [Deltaproteobacteria bacterium]
MLHMIRLGMVLAGVLTLGACTAPYKPPLDTEPHALLKLKYSYNSVLPNKTLRIRAFVKEGEDEPFRSAMQMDPPVSVSGGEVPLQTLLIRPGTDTQISVWLGFWWETQRMETTTSCNSQGMCTTSSRMVTDYHELGCEQVLKFSPEDQKGYLVDYNNPNVDKGCDAMIYEQTILPGGKFKLKPVGEVVKEAK